MNKKKNLFLADMYLPVMSGSRLYHHEVAKQLENVVVITRHEDEHDRASEAQFDAAAGFKIRRCWGIGRIFFPWLPQHRLVKWLTIYIAGVGTMMFWSLVISIRFRPAAIHAGPGLSTGTAARFLSSLYGVPYVIYEHGEQVAEYLNRSSGLGRLMKRIFVEAGAVVCNTHNTADMVKRLGVPPERIVVAYPGVDVQRFVGFERNEDTVKTKKGPVLLTVGYLITQKGHETTIRALPRLVKEWPNLRYLIVGDGPEQNQLTQLAVELNVAANVTFLGRVSESQLLEAYREADVYVQPSKVVEGVTEGYGIAFIEAGAAGLPVVGGRCGGVVEAVVDNVTGFLVSPGDVEDFYTAVSNLLRDGALRRRMGDAGRALSAKRTWNHTLFPVVDLDRKIRSRSLHKD